MKFYGNIAAMKKEKITVTPNDEAIADDFIILPETHYKAIAAYIELLRL